MTIGTPVQLEKAFLSLPRVEREAIISYGAALRLSSLRKRQFLAQSKIHALEGKYHKTLAQVDADGLPDDAGYEMHEDYVMWHHWQEILESVNRDIVALEKIAAEGFSPQGTGDVGD